MKSCGSHAIQLTPPIYCPPPLPVSSKVLDIGCGAGQTLALAYPDRVSFGIDIDFDALSLGRTFTDRVCFVCGKAEALPWPNDHFDLVIARVSLVYTNINTSLREIHRVLKQGGDLWVTLHPFPFPWRQVKSSNYKGWIFFAYIVLNSALFHLAGKQFPFLGRYESFQTEGSMSRALTRTGFRNISFKRGRHFLVTARSE